MNPFKLIKSAWASYRRYQDGPYLVTDATKQGPDVDVPIGLAAQAAGNPALEARDLELAEGENVGPETGIVNPIVDGPTRKGGSIG